MIAIGALGVVFVMRLADVPAGPGAAPLVQADVLTGVPPQDPLLQFRIGQR